MGVFDGFNISASGMTAQRVRLDTISENIANVNTTRTENGGPYRRKVVVFKESENSKPFSEFLSEAGVTKNIGVVVDRIVEEQSAFKKIYDPGNPDADDLGYIQMPNVEVVSEMVDMIDATRAYEANVTAMNSYKSMLLKTLEIGK